MENPIGPYLDDYTRLEQPGVALQLYELVLAYPWFTLGRYLQLRALRATDEAGYRRLLRQNDVRLFAHPWPGVLLETESSFPSDNFAWNAANNLPPYTANHPSSPPEMQPDTVSIIDQFLSNDELGERIMPLPSPEDYPQEDISVESVTDDGENATETLAAIYLNQGMPDRALEIYYKLSLKYPEKSTYFADLIGRVQRQYGLG